MHWIVAFTDPDCTVIIVMHVFYCLNVSLMNFEFYLALRFLFDLMLDYYMFLLPFLQIFSTSKCTSQISSVDEKERDQRSGVALHSKVKL